MLDNTGIHGYKGCNDPSIDPMKISQRLFWLAKTIEGPYDMIYEPGFYRADKEDSQNYYICFGHGAYWQIDKKLCERAEEVPITIDWKGAVRILPYAQEEVGYQPENKEHIKLMDVV